jgi:SEC-C motif domain protein
MWGPDVVGSRGSDTSNGQRVKKWRALSFLDLRACLNDVDVALLPLYVAATTVAFSPRSAKICQAFDVDGLLGPLCPCGSDDNYRACCGPFHHGELQARSAEELMRSRYSAYACGDADYLFRTWHPRTRPVEVVVDPRTVWTGLELIDTVAGGPDDDRGEVEFRARFESEGRAGSLHERSRFERRVGRWFYVDPVTEDV